MIVTTDPASNLADVFEQEIGHQVVPIHAIDRLFAMEIDPDRATEEYRERIIGPFREIMPADVVTSLEEQFRSPCTTEIASFDRFVDFMEASDFEVVIFDTAPTGHTIRLLELPVDWSRHIEESARGAGQTCLGPVQAIQASKAKYDRAAALLRDPSRTTFLFVVRPEELALYETVRAAHELETIGITAPQIIVNGLLPEEACDNDFFRKQRTAQEQVLIKIEQTFGKPKGVMLLHDQEIKGVPALREAAQELFAHRRVAAHASSILPSSVARRLPQPNLERLFFPTHGTKAIFFTGKGGVGKTTLSSLIALFLSRQGFRTLIVTTDPAAHLGIVFDRPVGTEPTAITENLFAAMIDQKAAFQEYKARVLDDARGQISDEMLAVMEEELNSPCTEEMAIFERFAQYLESDSFQIVVFDMAPTGHTLRLLDLPFDYAKQVDLMVTGGEAGVIQRQAVSNRYQDLIRQLRDKDHSAFCLVLYPESTPILESYRAMQDLREAGIETQLAIANRLLPEEACSNDFGRRRRQMQERYLEEIERRFQLPLLTFPLLFEEIYGLAKLEAALAYLPQGVRQPQRGDFSAIHPLQPH